MRENLSTIAGAVRSVPSAREKLRELFIEKDWIDSTDKPTESQLVEIALGRIKRDVNDYKEFVSILEKMSGMDQIVKLLPRKNLLTLCVHVLFS